MFRLLICTALLFGLLPAAPAADWPQWRGPNRDGSAPGAELPAKWPADAPKPKWTAPVGDGYSAPAIAGGKVFIMGKVKGQERCLCFNADTGKELWKVEYPESFAAPDPTAGKGPNSTPTVDRDRVYTFGLGGMFHCIDSDSGKVLWKHDCNKEYWGVSFAEGEGFKSDNWFPVCGASASALVDGERVILPVGGKKAGTFTAFDRYSGKVEWKALEDRSSYASPVIRTLAGVKQLVDFTGTRMVGIDHATHELLWDYPVSFRYEQTIISPIVWNDLVIVAGEGKSTVALKVVKGEGKKLKAAVAWKSDDIKSYLTSPVVMADHLIGHDMRKNCLACVDLATGETAWTSPRVPGKYHSLVAAGDTLLVLNSEGELFAFKVTPTECTELAKWKVAEKGTWAHLAVAGSRLYVKDKDTLYCYELR